MCFIFLSYCHFRVFYFFLYQPRECMRAAEVNTVKRLDQCFADLKCVDVLGLGAAKNAENVLGPRRGGLPV